MAQKNIGNNWDRDSRNAINDNFEELYANESGAGPIATEAIRAATEALGAANIALGKSESTQTQLDTIVVKGDSSVESAQARIGADGKIHATLKTRLDAENKEVSQQLADTVKLDDVGVLGLNVFDDNARNILQGQEPGTINAVLGEGNVNLINLEVDLRNNLIESFSTFDKAYEDLGILEKSGLNLARDNYAALKVGFSAYETADANLVVNDSRSFTVKSTVVSNGLGLLFPPTKVSMNQEYTISADLRTVPSAILGVSCYDKDKTLIAESGLLSISGLTYVTTYRGYLYTGGNPQPSYTFGVVDDRVAYVCARAGIYSQAAIVEDVTIYDVKLEKGKKATPWSPALEDLNAHPFVGKLAEVSYRSQINEKDIKKLNNAVIALGGSV